MLIASFPLIRMMPIPPSPGGVETAQIVSSSCMGVYYHKAQSLKTSFWNAGSNLHPAKINSFLRKGYFFIFTTILSFHAVKPRFFRVGIYGADLTLLDVLLGLCFLFDK